MQLSCFFPQEYAYLYITLCHHDKIGSKTSSIYGQSVGTCDSWISPHPEVSSRETYTVIAIMIPYSMPTFTSWCLNGMYYERVSHDHYL